MTDTKLRSLIAQAVSLDREIAVKSDELKQLKEQLALEAETRAESAIATNGGGASITFEGDDGCIARVTTACATLKSTVKPTDKKFPQIKEAAGGSFSRLFETEVVHKPVAGFRDQAVELLGEKPAGKLLKLCTNPGKTTVSFETKEAAAA